MSFTLMQPYQFPHFSRLFSAFTFRSVVSTLMWAVFLAIAITNIRLAFRYYPAHVLLISSQHDAENFRVQQKLADIFVRSGHVGAGEMLSQYAQTLLSVDSVLGASVQKQKISDTLPYWLSIIARHPDYRDAYIEAAGLAIAERQPLQSLELIDKALSLDPNNQQALVFRTLLLKEIR